MTYRKTKSTTKYLGKLLSATALALVLSYTPAYTASLDENITIVNQELGEAAEHISNANLFVELLDAQKINQLHNMASELTKKIGNSQYVKNIQVKGLSNKFMTGNTKNINSLTKRVKTLSGNIRIMKSEKVKLNALARRIPKNGNFIKNVSKGAKFLGRATYAVDMAQNTGVLIGKYKQGSLTLKDGLNYVLDASAVLDKAYLIQGARYIEKTFESILDEKKKITKNLEQEIKTARSNIDYFTKDAMITRLNNPLYREKLSSAITSDQVLDVITNAKLKNIEVLKREAIQLTNLINRINGRDSNFFSFQYDIDEQLQASMIAQVENLKKVVMGNLAVLHNDESSLFYVNTALSIKTDIEFEIIRNVIKAQTIENNNLIARVSEAEIVINSFVETTNKQLEKLIVSSEKTQEQLELVDETPDVTEEQELSDLKDTANGLREENSRLSQQVLALHEQINDESLSESQRSVLQNELKGIETLINVNADAYIEARTAIRETDPDYGVPVDNAFTIRNRVEKQIALRNAEEQDSPDSNPGLPKLLADQEELLAQKAQEQVELRQKQQDIWAEIGIKRDNLNQLISNRNQKISNINNQLSSKRRELQDLLNSAQKPTQPENVYNEQYMTLIQNRSTLVEVSRYRRKVIDLYKRQLAGTYNGEIISSADSAWLKKVAREFGVSNWKAFLMDVNKKHLPEARDDLADFVATSSIYTQTSSSNSGATDQARLAQLQNEIASLQNELDSVLSSDSGSSFSSLEAAIETLEEEYNEIVADIESSMSELSTLVSDVNDADKVATASSSSSVEYAASFSAVSSNGLMTGTDADIDGETTEATVGASIVPNGTNINAVFSGTYTVATLVDTGYTYTSWGTWAATTPAQTKTESDGTVYSLAGGHWVQGQHAEDIPAQGSATFNGSVTGDHFDAVGNLTQNSISGTVTLNADFANSSITGGMTLSENGNAWVNPTLSGGTINLSQGSFDASLAGGTSGSIGGSFHGETGVKPTEVGGSWHFFHSDNTKGIGVFNAKQ